MQQKMNMIRHDHESIEEEWFMLLNTIDLEDCFLCKSRILKMGDAMMGDAGYQQRLVTLNEMPLGHGNIICD